MGKGLCEEAEGRWRVRRGGARWDTPPLARRARWGKTAAWRALALSLTPDTDPLRAAGQWHVTHGSKPLASACNVPRDDLNRTFWEVPWVLMSTKIVLQMHSENRSTGCDYEIIMTYGPRLDHAAKLVCFHTYRTQCIRARIQDDPCWYGIM